MTRPSPDTAITEALIIDWIDAEGRITGLNEAGTRAFGITLGEGEAIALERVYSPPSAQQLRRMARAGAGAGAGTGGPLPAGIPVWVNTPHYSEVPMLASLVADGERGLAVVKQPLSATALGIGPELVERVEILSQMIGAATEACWCIEFLEPVNIALAEDEIVECIFANQRRWRACNDAMARLYRVPEGSDFNLEPVSRYFPDNEINRLMVRKLVRASFRLDHATAMDRRHDGTEMLVENDFRAAIRDGELTRLWGITRDIGPSRRREQQLADRAERMLDILSAAPDPILVISEEGVVLATNPAAEAAWSRSADQILGRSVQEFVETRHAVDKLRQAALAEDGAECDLGIILGDIPGDGGREVWRFHSARIEGAVSRYVVTARRKPRRRARLPEREAAE